MGKEKIIKFGKFEGPTVEGINVRRMKIVNGGHASGDGRLRRAFIREYAANGGIAKLSGLA